MPFGLGQIYDSCTYVTEETVHTSVLECKELCVSSMMF